MLPRKRYDDTTKFADLQGETLIRIDQDGQEILRFITNSGRAFVLFHSQNCCETVEIESIIGDLDDLINTPILLAEEATSEEDPEGFTPDKDFYRNDSQTWTFYKLRTIKGSVDIRWYGSSNGYYSESVDFMEERK